MSGEFSEEARVALASAKERARTHGAETCGLQALLGALLENLDELSFQGLERMGLDPERLIVPHQSSHTTHYAGHIELPLDRMAKNALALAIDNAGGRRLSPSHLLLAALELIENQGLTAAYGLPGALNYAKLKASMDEVNGLLARVVERFNWETVNSLYLARKIAVDLRNLKMGLPHLLGGILMEPSTQMLALTSSLGLDTEGLLEKSLEAVAHGAGEWRSITKPALSGQALEALSFACSEAQAMEFKQFGSSHLFLGILRASQTGGDLAGLSGLEVDLGKVRWGALKMANWTNKQDTELEKFGPESIRVLSGAARRAREGGSEAVDINHIIIALLDDPSNSAYKAISSHGADILTITAALQNPSGSRKKPAGAMEIPEVVTLTEVARKALELAKAEAKSLGRRNVESDCILLGLLGVEEGAGMFKGGGLDYHTLKNAMIKGGRK